MQMPLETNRRIAFPLDPSIAILNQIAAKFPATTSIYDNGVFPLLRCSTFITRQKKLCVRFLTTRQLFWRLQ
jgi:hypothetical protein